MQLKYTSCRFVYLLYMYVQYISVWLCFFQDQLSAIADNADRCEKKQEVLELHNEVLM